MNDTYFKMVFDDAEVAAFEAAKNCVPVPMTVYSADLWGNRLGPNEHVSEGVCGFAWVTLKPATSAFARWLKKHNHARSGTYGGLEISMGKYAGFSQSMERKEAAARAFAKVLQENGFQCYSESRMD